SVSPSPLSASSPPSPPTSSVRSAGEPRAVAMASYSPSEMEAMASSWSSVKLLTRASICSPVSLASETRAVRPDPPTSARAASASLSSLTCPGLRVKLMDYSGRNGSDQAGRGWSCGRPLLRGLHVTDTGRVRSADSCGPRGVVGVGEVGGDKEPVHVELLAGLEVGADPAIAAGVAQTRGGPGRLHAVAHVDGHPSVAIDAVGDLVVGLVLELLQFGDDDWLVVGGGSRLLAAGGGTRGGGGVADHLHHERPLATIEASGRSTLTASVIVGMLLAVSVSNMA